jgi:hypothetical protein
MSVMPDPKQPDAYDFDWGADFDDLDPDYWEDYYAGPEDEDFERAN